MKDQVKILFKTTSHFFQRLQSQFSEWPRGLVSFMGTWHVFKVKKMIDDRALWTHIFLTWVIRQMNCWINSMRRLQKHKYTRVCHAGFLMWCPPKRYYQVFGDTREMCTAEIIQRKQGCPSSLIWYFWSVLKRKNNEVSRFATKEKGFYKIQVDFDFQAGFPHPFNAALDWLHIHFLRQGTTEDISAYKWKNVAQEKYHPHLPNHPSAAKTFFRKGPQEVPHPWSPADCNGMGRHEWVSNPRV